MKGKGWAILAATTITEAAGDGADGQHGMLMGEILPALTHGAADLFNKGFVTMTDINMYIKHKFVEITSQHPNLTSQEHAMLRFPGM